MFLDGFIFIGASSCRHLTSSQLRLLGRFGWVREYLMLHLPPDTLSRAFLLPFFPPSALALVPFSPSLPHAFEPRPQSRAASNAAFTCNPLEYTTSSHTLNIWSKMANAGRQVHSWNSKTHEDILISLFQHVKFNINDLHNVMVDLTDKGYTFSESALRYDHSSHLRVCVNRFVLSYQCFPSISYHLFRATHLLVLLHVHRPRTGPTKSRCLSLTSLHLATTTKTQDHSTFDLIN